jgi:Peptidase S46
VLNEYATKGPEQERTSSTLKFDTENSLKAYKGRQLALVEGPLMSDKARAEDDLRRKVAADKKLAAGTSEAWDAIAAALKHHRDIYVRNAVLERFPHAYRPCWGARSNSTVTPPKSINRTESVSRNIPMQTFRP